MSEELRERARAVARRTLEERWTAGRFELELETEHAPQWNHLFDRSHYAASFRVFELAETALVTLGPRGDVVGARVPATRTAESETAAPELPPELALRVRAAAEDASRRAGRWQALRSSVAAVLEGDGEPGGREVLVRLFACVPEGSLSVDLDGISGEALGHFAPCLLRGSRAGRALSRQEVIARVEESGVVPPGLRVARADQEEAVGSRLWRIRYEAHGLEQTGTFVVCAHARSGVVVGTTSTLRARVRLGRGTSRERAHALVERALPVLLGPEARLVALVAGAVVGRGTPRAGWVGTAVVAEREVVRVALAGDEVEVRVRGKLARARVEPDRVVLQATPRRARGRVLALPEPEPERAPEAASEPALAP